MSDFFLKTGDTLPRIRCTLKDGSGQVVDVTGATVTLRMSALAGTTRVEGTATLVDAAHGVVEYAWGSGDTNVAGSYRVEWVVTWPDTDKQTFPNRGFLTVVIGDRA